MKIYAQLNEKLFEYESINKDEQHQLLFENKIQDFDVKELGPGRYSLIRNGESYLVHIRNRDGACHVTTNGEQFNLNVEDERTRQLKELVSAAQNGPEELNVKAPIPGVVINIPVEEGQLVEKGAPLLILEAMKMENIIKADCNCTVEKIRVQEKEAVQQNQELIVMRIN